MSCLWDPLTLTFSNARLEAHYSQYLLLNEFLKADEWFSVFNIPASLLIGWVVLMRKRSFLYYFLFATFVNFSFAFCVKSTVRLYPYRLWLIKHRTTIILVLRTHQVAATVTAFCVFPVEVAGYIQGVRVIGFVAACWFWSFVMPLKFKIHLIHHTLTSMIAFLCISYNFCGQHSDLWIGVYRAMSLTKESTLQADEQCRRDLILILFALGFAMPTAIVWATQLNSRKRYLEEIGIQINGSIKKAYMWGPLSIATLSVWVLIKFCL